jgi:hemoglobin
LTDRPSLYAFAGGEVAFLKLAAAHHERCVSDPVLAHPFEHMTNPGHVEALANYWGEVFGGPPRFSEVSSQTAMQRLHAGNDGSAELSERFVDCFVAAMDDAGLPADPEFRRVMREYMVWAVADVDAYAPSASVVPDGLRVPRWSWAGLQT